MTINITPNLDTPELPPSGGTPTAEISFTTTGKAQVSSRQVVLCIDTSGSMGVRDEDGVKKIERARRGAKQVLEELTEDDYLAVVGFTSESSVYSSMQQWGDSSKGPTESTIDAIEASNGTDIIEGIEAAWEQFSGLPDGPSTVRRIVLLSDGEGVHSTSDYRSLAEDIVEDNISIVAAGIGSDYDEDAILALAEGSRGEPTHLTNATDIETFFESQISDAGSVVSTKPELQVKTGEQMRLNEAFIAPPHARSTGVETGDQKATIELPDITTDEEVRVTMQFLAPPRQGGLSHKLAELRLIDDEELASETLTVEYAEETEITPSEDGIQVAHADAKVSSGIRNPDITDEALEQTVDEIAEANPDWDEVIERLRNKLDQSDDVGGTITAGIARIDPDEEDR